MPVGSARFLGPSVLIVCPGDMNYLRRSTIKLFRKLQLHVANDHGLDVYDYVTEKSATGFNSWMHAQLQIPPPTDPLCRAVICFFGERIGTPLSGEVALDAMLSSPALTRTQGPRAMLPGELGMNIADRFPLTGSTFEYLAAVEEAQRRRLPVLLLFLAEPTVLTNPVLKARWGDRREFDRVFKQFGDDLDGFRAWLDGTYQPQLEHLRNFVRYVSEEKGAVSFVESEDQAMERVRLFLTEEVGLRDAEREVVPFKGLAPYDVDDWPILFGRREWRVTAITALTTQLDRRDEPNLMHVVGGSGSGKSSLMRAGLIGPLCHQSWYGDFVACVVRPHEIGPDSADGAAGGRVVPVVARLSARALKKIDTQADEAREEETLSRVGADVLVDEAVAKLRSALEAGSGDPTHARRLIIGIDQFEEIIDAVLTPAGEPVWMPLLRFMEMAAGEPRIVVVCTVQSNRRELMERSGIFAGLYGKGQTKEVFAPLDILDIVQKPFAFRRLTLEPKLEGELVNRIRRLFGADFQSSVLPLVSLALTRLHAEWERRRSKTPVIQPDVPREPSSGAAVHEREVTDRAAKTFAGAAAPPPASGPGGATGNWSLRYDDYKDFVDIEEAIGKAADQSVQDAKDNARLFWDDDAIASLLRRLVRMTHDGRLSFPSIELPGNTMIRRLAETLSERRLVAREGPQRFRLVHEAVVHHWPAARDWLAEEQTILERFSTLKPTAKRWRNSSNRDELLEGVGALQLQDGAELLALWPDVLGGPSPPSPDSDEALVREFVLALLLHHATPDQRVVGPKRTTTHTHLVSYYGRTDIIRRFLEVDPSAATLTRSDGRTPLFEACWSGQAELVEVFIAHGAPVNQADVDGWLPVHAAATIGSVNCLRMLAPQMPDLNTVGANGLTALHLATMGGHLDAVRLLLDDLARRGADVNAIVDSRGWTALHVATGVGDAAILRVLLGHSADPRRVENLGWTPLHLAAQGPGGGEAIRLLLEGGAEIDARFGLGYQPLHLAAQNGVEDAARVLLSAGASPLAVLDNGWTPLHIAASDNRVALVRLLIAHGAKTEIPAYNDWSTVEDTSTPISRSNPGWRPLHVAAARGHEAVASALLELGAHSGSRTDRGQTPLHLAAEHGHSRVVEILLQSGAVVDARDIADVRPIDLSVKAERFDVARLLINAGAQVDEPNADRLTLLDIAAREGREAAVRFLLSVGATGGADAVTRLGLAPLHAAAERGQDAVVDALLDAGGDADLRDAFGWGAVHIAAQNGRVAVLQTLANRGANLAMRVSTPPWSALQVAAETGQVACIRMLVEHGADVFDESGGTRSPFYLSIKNGHFPAALVLLELGADPRRTDLDAEPSVAALIEFRQTHRAGDRPSTDEDRLVERLRDLGFAIRHEPAATIDVVSGGSAPGAGLPRTVFADVRTITHGSLARSSDLMAPAAVDSGESPWRRPSEEFKAWLVGAVTPIDGRHAVGLGAEVVLRSLTWYERVLLVRVRDPEWRGGLHAFYLLDDRMQLFRLAGASPPIHDVNAKAPIQLRESNVLDYLRFFCFFVRGEAGPFYVLEDPQDPLVSTADPAVQSILESAARPATFDGAGGLLHCSAVISYSNMLFKATFKVEPTGMIEMVDDEPIAAELPFKIEAPLG